MYTIWNLRRFINTDAYHVDMTGISFCSRSQKKAQITINFIIIGTHSMVKENMCTCFDCTIISNISEKHKCRLLWMIRSDTHGFMYNQVEGKNPE